MNNAPKGYRAARQLRQREADRRGGQVSREDGLPRARVGDVGWMRDSYEQYLQMRNYTADSIEGRLKSLWIFLEWALERDLTRAEEITRPVLESYQRWLWRYRKKNGKPLGISTQRARIGVLKDWFKWMVRQNYLLANPASDLEFPRAEQRLPVEGLSVKQLQAVLDVPDRNDPLGVRDRAMLEVFYSTGIRRGELCNLQLGDINQDRQTLRVNLGKGRKDRVVPIGPRALRWVEKYLQDVRPLLCIDTRQQGLFMTSYGDPFNRDVLSRMVSKIIDEADIGRTGSCHLLRHTCAMHMLEGGADIRFIQQLFGHAKMSTTAIYTQVSIKQLQDVHARCHPAGQLQD